MTLERIWNCVDDLIDRAPSLADLEAHRLHHLAGRRWRALGSPIPPALRKSEELASVVTLSARAVLERTVAAYPERMALMKGLEVAELYPSPTLRPFGDIDLLVEDAPAAQQALVAAGFVEYDEPEIYEDIHHLRPLALPGFPVGIELHHEPKWPEHLGTAPSAARLLDAGVPSVTGVAGLLGLRPADHAICLAAHAWAHEPLLRVGHLLDVAVVSTATSEQELAGVAREFGFERPWRSTSRALDVLFGGARTSPALALWARNLRNVEERSVLATHARKWLSPFSERPLPASAFHALQAIADDVRPVDGESWPRKSARLVRAFRHARMSRLHHDVVIGDDANLGNAVLQRIRERTARDEL